MAKYAIYKGGKWRKYPHGGAWASKADVAKELRSKGYKLLVPQEQLNMRWNTGNMVRKGQIEKVGEEQVYTRNLMVFGYSNKDIDVEYRVWIVTEEDLENPRTQLKNRMKDFIEAHPPETDELRRKLKEIMDSTETNAEVSEEEVKRQKGVWHGVANYNGRPAEPYEVRSGPKSHDIKQQTLFKV